jgi:uncharacterized protein YyaL (SSP411 family)
MSWPATIAPHTSALALPVAARTVHVLHPSRDAARLEALIPPAQPSSAVYVCRGALCSAPTQEADDLLWWPWLRRAERRPG